MAEEALTGFLDTTKQYRNTSSFVFIIMVFLGLIELVITPTLDEQGKEMTTTVL